MTTNFALSLSFKGIDLLHRVQQGWRLIGSAKVEDPELDATLARMRETAQAIDPSGLRTKILLPLEQIKYLAIAGTQTDLSDIHAALDGATPYALDELVIDCERSGGRTHIAAVARETLQEAEAFASGHGFNPVCFVAVPEPFTFQNEIFFGPTEMMPEVLGPDGTVERDPLPVLEVGTRIESRLLIVDDTTVTHNEMNDVDIDPTVSEYHSPTVSANPAAQKTHAGILSDVMIDTIIAEHHLSLVQPQHLVAQTATQKAPRAVVSLTADKKRVPQAKNRRPLVAATAIAAGIALVVGLVWAQRPQSPIEAPQAITATLAPDTTTSATTAQAEAEILPDPQTVQPMQGVTRFVPLKVTQLAPATPDLSPAPVMPALAVLAATTTADTPLFERDGPAAPPITESITATADAPVLRGLVLSPDEAAAIYATTGVWQRSPRFASTPRSTSTADIDRPGPLPAPARIAQPSTAALVTDKTDLSFLAPADPPPADMKFTIDEDGFVLATPEGALTPEGAIVFAGLPDIDVRVRPLLNDDPAEIAPLAPALEGVVVVSGPPPIQPPLRPNDLAPDNIPPGGVALTSLEPDRSLTEAEVLTTTDPVLVGIRPRLRPAGIVPARLSTDLTSNPDITSVIAGLEEDAFIDITPRAVDSSQRPETRPRNFARVVEIARSREQAAPAPSSNDQPSFEVTLPQSTAPVPGGVARAATEDGVIGLREMNLIGVYGRANDRRALVRLSNGRYLRVEVGSTLDGGQVTAIGESALNYVKRGRTYSLELPAG